MNELLRRLLFLPEQASTVARRIDGLHYIVISVTMIGAALVAFAALYFVVRYRDRGGAPVAVATRGELRVEYALWGMTLLLFLGFWVVGFRQYVELRSPPANAIDVYVTGKQWMWKFAHPDGFGEVGVLTVPAHQPVRLLLTSRDVIHSFYVPDFRIKQDAVPGRYTVAWFEATKPGRYAIRCAELCGVSHSEMSGEVVVLDEGEYDAWIRSSRPSGDAVSMVEQGRAAAVRNQCLACHTIDGRAHVGPSFRGLYGSTVALEGGRAQVADEAYLTRSMMEPEVDIVAGYKPVMPRYEAVLSAPEVAALVAFIKDLRTGEEFPSQELPPVWPVPSARMP